MIGNANTKWTLGWLYLWVRLSLSAGLARSATPAPTRHHFIVGAQKKTVFGPAGCSQMPLSFPGTNLSTELTTPRYNADAILSLILILRNKSIIWVQTKSSAGKNLNEPFWRDEKDHNDASQQIWTSCLDFTLNFVFVLFPLFLGPRFHGESVNGLHFLFKGGVDQLMSVFERNSIEFVRDDDGVPLGAASVGQILQTQVKRREAFSQFPFQGFASRHSFRI